MSISQNLSKLSDTDSPEKIPPGVLGYIHARARNQLHELVLREFRRSGLSKAVLASRLDKEPSQITRWLGAPGNWTLDTVSNLLLAISGSTLKFEVEHPQEAAKTNLRVATFVDSSKIRIQQTTARATYSSILHYTRETA